MTTTTAGRVTLPGGGWADAEALARGLLDDPPPITVEPAEVAPPEPGTEYLRVGLVRCGCPRHVVGRDSSTPVIVLRHRPECAVRHERLATQRPPARRVPPGVIACPDCGNVQFSLVSPEWNLPGWRRCDGPAGCGRGFDPTKPALAVLPGTDQPRRARESRPALLSTDVNEEAVG